MLLNFLYELIRPDQSSCPEDDNSIAAGRVVWDSILWTLPVVMCSSICSIKQTDRKFTVPGSHIFWCAAISLGPLPRISLSKWAIKLSFILPSAVSWHTISRAHSFDYFPGLRSSAMPRSLTLLCLCANRSGQRILDLCCSGFYIAIHTSIDSTAWRMHIHTIPKLILRDNGKPWGVIRCAVHAADCREFCSGLLI